VENSEDILRELRELAPKLAALQKSNPYRVPEGYFVNFANEIVKKTSLSETREELKAIAPELSAIKKEVLADAPHTYFQGFPEYILKNIRKQEVADELLKEAPTLAALNKVNTLQVPANYFSQLPQNILENIKTGQVSSKETSPGLFESVNKVVEKIASSIFKPKYSVAFAGFSTLVIIGVMMLVKVEQCGDLDCKFAQLTNDEINSYLAQNSDEVFESALDDNTLPASVQTNSIHPYTDALNDINEADLQEALDK